jgi:hypothetical protein
VELPLTKAGKVGYRALGAEAAPIEPARVTSA